jgi:penicillin-binding protein 1A
MVLGSSDVRLIEMTRAFASVANQGVAVTPFGITRVTANGETIYQMTVDRSHVLVAPQVAAEMTDLLQTAVNTGTGRAAQIGRPVAGKTGTTSSNKDGWFLGFSSGLTTGVWMGRDDAKSLPGLQGGRNPARAFAAMMQVALRTRPVQNFQTEVTLPEWQLEPDEEAYYGDPDQGMTGDNEAVPQETQDQAGPDDTAPVEEQQPAPAPRKPPAAERPPATGAHSPQIDQKWLDNVLKDQPRQPQPH